jgi:hypothetical protein
VLSVAEEGVAFFVRSYATKGLEAFEVVVEPVDVPEAVVVGARVMIPPPSFPPPPELSMVLGPGPEGVEVPGSVLEVTVLPYPDPVPMAEDTAPPMVGPPKIPEIELAKPNGPPKTPAAALVTADTGLFMTLDKNPSTNPIPVTVVPGPLVVLLLAVGVEDVGETSVDLPVVVPVVEVAEEDLELEDGAAGVEVGAF